MNLLTTIGAFVLALGCLIVIHELGHYLVARMCTVKVLRFSVGFGRPLWIRKMGRDETEWVIAAFPLGGYVKMADEREGEMDPADLPRAFNRQSVYRRIAIVAAGPAANFLLAIVFYWALFVHGVPGMKPILGPIGSNTPAAMAGFMPGELLVKIEGEPVHTWQDARWLLLQHAVRRAVISVESVGAGQTTQRRNLDLSALQAKDLDGDFLRVLGFERYQPVLKPVIGKTIGGGAAERAGLGPGDEIIAINNQPVSSWEEVVTMIRANPGKTLTLEVRRKGALLPAITVTPASELENGRPVGKIGAAPLMDRGTMAELLTEVRYGPLAAMGKAVHKTWDTSIFTLKMLAKMVIGEVSLKNLSGPITIADYAGQTAQSGWVSYMMFLALISISLGVLNLLPIPLLDGGHLMYYMVEILKGSPVSDRVMEMGQQVGMVLLFMLMAFAIYNDINRLING
jgi:regulator of sigma E protease